MFAANPQTRLKMFVVDMQLNSTHKSQDNKL